MKKLLVIFILIFCNADNFKEIKMDRELSDLIDSYWSDYVKHKGKEYIVSPSIPIVWFGDIEAYKKSKIKVVTIAINPSNNEFPKGADGEPSFSRFPNAEKLYAKERLTQEDKILLAGTLNGYFKNEPYMKWFDYYEKPLNVLGVSYKSGENIALHIDIYTALATNPKWTGSTIINGKERKLTQKEKNSITNIDLFKKLLDYLKPSVIIFSTDKDGVRKIFPNARLDERYPPDKNKIEVYTFDKMLIIKAKNNTRPFMFSGVEDAMRQIKQEYKEYFTND